MDNSLRNKLYEYIGEASMCWTEPPKGVFDSQRAVKITEEMIFFIDKYYLNKNREEKLKRLLE
jgi:hypothetical protein